MPPESSQDERRRTRRVSLQVPLQVQWRGRTHRARTLDLNEHGAQVVCATTCPAGSVLEVTNLQTRRTARFRVIWAWFGDGEGTNRFRLGIEGVDASPDFWGLDYGRSPGSL